MKGLVAAALLVPALLSTSGEARAQPASPEAEPLSLDQLLEISSVVGGETPRWSPDGSRILFVSALTGGLATLHPAGGHPVRVPVEMGEAGHFLARQEPRWSPDGRWVSWISARTGDQELWLWSPEDGRELQLTRLGARINSYSWSPDGRSVAVAGDRHGGYDIWRISVPDGRAERLTRDGRYEVFPSWAPDGRILYVRLDDTWADHEVLEIPAEGGEPRLVVEDTDFFDYQAGGKFGYPQASPDGRQVMFRSHRSGWINYWMVPRQGGEPRPVAAAEADQSDASWSPDGRWIAYTENQDGTHELRIVRSSGGEPRVLVAPEGMGVVSRPAWSPDGGRISYTLGTPTAPNDLYVVEVENGRTTRLTRSTPEGNLERRLVVPEKVTYPSTDGHEISAYLYRPPEWAVGEGGKVPGLLWIHGGPTGQFHDSFQQHVQYFVQRGYAVLLPNIRGSSGYGKAFEDANNGCWGRCDMEDVEAGVEFLRTLPEVDPELMGITGTSYGGCMSIAALAFAPDLFQASIPLSGYADWIHFYGEQELRHIKLLDYELGPLDGNEELYRNLSAIYFVDRVKTPTFLIHGEGRFPRSTASKDFAEALEKHYKPFEYKAYPNENYYVYGRENRRQMLQDMLAFLDLYLKGPGVAPAD